MLSDPQLHYLDNAATSRVDPAVAQAVSEALTELWANPSSLYDPAVAAQDAIAAARARVAKTLHCRSDEIYFTACGSEGNNMAVTGAARPRKHWGNKIVVTGFEHPSVQRPIRALKDEGFTVVEVMPGADGRIDTQKFLAEIDKNTVLAACMAVNNETGAVQDIAALGKAIGSMVYFADGQATCMHLSAQDKVDCGAQDADLGGIVNYALYMDGVRMCFMADEDVQGNWKYSLRALPGEDVSDIARSFGGGGHALASGCTIAGPYADSSRAMMNAMEKKLLK